MEQTTQEKLQILEEKIDTILASVEKTRKYITITVWVTAIMFVLPLAALLFIVPKAINEYASLLNSL